MNRYEIPTHLGVQDKLVLGLSPRQLMVALAGLMAAYAVWVQLAAWAWLPLPGRTGVVATIALTAVVAAAVRPHGRGLDAWAFVLARYAASPRVCVWRPGGAVPVDWLTPPAARQYDLPPTLLSYGAPGRAARRGAAVEE